MPKSIQLVELPKVHEYNNETFVSINKLLDNGFLKQHERDFLLDLRKNFRVYEFLSSKQFKWFYALKKQYLDNQKKEK